MSPRWPWERVRTLSLQTRSMDLEFEANRAAQSRDRVNVWRWENRDLGATCTKLPTQMSAVHVVRSCVLPVVTKAGAMFILGGQDFTVSPNVPPVCPPPQAPGAPLPLCRQFVPNSAFFNDVLRSTDGAHWELVAMKAGWSARPGHQCQVLLDTIVGFGGFGLAKDPSGTVAGHPVDMWVSRDGTRWPKLTAGPRNATSYPNATYDFDSLVVSGGPGCLPPSIFTFGGDREASFIAPDPTLVANEVWRFSQPLPSK